MSNSTINITVEGYGKEGRNIDLPVDGGAHIREGTMVAQLTATKMLCPGSTGSSGRCVGVATHEQDASTAADGAKRCTVTTDQIFIMANSVGDACTEAACALGVPVYMEDDHTIAKTKGSLQQAGYFAGLEPDGRVRVFVRLEADATDADLTSLETRLSTDESVTSGSAIASLDTRVSTEEATESTAVASLNTRVSTETSTRGSAVTSLDTRVSTVLSTEVANVASLDTRVSTEVSSRGSGDASIDLRLSALYSYVSF